MVDENLCAQERGERMRSAVVMLGVALVALVLFTELGPRFGIAIHWRALVAIPFFGAALQLVQAYSGVCIFHAKRGTRATAGYVEGVLDPRQRARMQKLGRGVLASAGVITMVATVLVLAVAYVA
jgi:hypothetical protein